MSFQYEKFYATENVLFLVIYYVSKIERARTTITVQSAEVSENQIQPRMEYISSYGTELTISSSGKASISGFIRGKTGVTDAYVKVTLQKKVSGSWTYVNSWETSGKGRNASILETYSVSRGTYRVVAYIKAGTESKSQYQQKKHINCRRFCNE